MSGFDFFDILQVVMRIVFPLLSIVLVVAVGILVSKLPNAATFIMLFGAVTGCLASLARAVALPLLSGTVVSGPGISAELIFRMISLIGMIGHVLFVLGLLLLAIKLPKRRASREYLKGNRLSL